LGHIENSDYDNDEKIVKEEKALKTVFKKQFKGKCRICGKIGHKGVDCWALESNKDKRPAINHGRENGEKNIISQMLVTIATRRDIEKQNVALS